MKFSSLFTAYGRKYNIELDLAQLTIYVALIKNVNVTKEIFCR